MPAAAVRQGRLKDQHYTISTAGVTAFTRVDRWRMDAQFTPLVQWQREAAHFEGVRRARPLLQHHPDGPAPSSSNTPQHAHRMRIEGEGASTLRCIAYSLPLSIARWPRIGT